MNEVKSALITAAFVNQPKPGKKNGTIKCPDEDFYLAKPPILAQFQPGGQYKISYEQYNIGGKDFKEIKTVEQVGSAPTGQPAGRGGYHQDEGLAERIFVCGALNATLGNPNIKPDEIPGSALENMVKKYRQVWAATFGKPVPKDDMDGDGIPY